MYYKITVLKKDEEGDLVFMQEEIVEAESEMDARQVYHKSVQGAETCGEIIVEETTLKQLIEREQAFLRQRLVSRYASMHYADRMAARDFCRMMRSDASPEKEKIYYEALKDLIRRMQVTDLLEEQLDPKRLLFADYCKLRDALWAETSAQKFEQRYREAIAQYGKDVEAK